MLFSIIVTMIIFKSFSFFFSLLFITIMLFILLSFLNILDFKKQDKKALFLLRPRPDRMDAILLLLIFVIHFLALILSIIVLALSIMLFFFKINSVAILFSITIA